MILPVKKGYFFVRLFQPRSDFYVVDRFLNFLSSRARYREANFKEVPLCA